ncbi:MAG TPA: protein-disulfide reductase DsbD domain-containing protein [Microvirga sp.]|nr:protein-disulfide reductase DsbD domain-containing protein [Microvirga sp.]
MTIVLRLLAAAVIGVAGFPEECLAEGASPWAEGFHSRARLVSGGSMGAEHWAGVEIVLDPDFKTYWRDPGESGLPPRFDWSGSENAQAIDLRWPAPSRTEDAAGVTYTYAHRVVFPVRVVAADAGKPVTLRLDLEYGVCKEICIPARAALDLTLDKGESRHRAVIDQALARVPRPQRLGADDAVSILALERIPAGKPAYGVKVRSPAGAALFAEAPENWYLSVSRQQPDGRFTVTIEEKPREAAGPITLRLTLVAGGQAVETDVHLDENLAAR